MATLLPFEIAGNGRKIATWRLGFITFSMHLGKYMNVLRFLPTNSTYSVIDRVVNINRAMLWWISTYHTHIDYEIPHFRRTKRRRRIVEESVEEPPQSPVTVAMVPEPSCNPFVVLGSPVDQGADAATPLDSNKNKTDQKNREMWMRTDESTWVL